MSRFDPTQSLLAGMDTSVLQANLATAQQAYIDLSTGAKGESYSYTQGDGNKSVTYTRANLGQLTQLIMLLQRQLGVAGHRRALRPSF